MLDSKFEIVSVCEPYNYGQIFLRYTAFRVCRINESIKDQCQKGSVTIHARGHEFL